MKQEGLRQFLKSRKAPKLHGIFNFDVNMYRCNLKRRKISKGKESEKKTPLAAMEKT